MSEERKIWEDLPGLAVYAERLEWKWLDSIFSGNSEEGFEH